MTDRRDRVFARNAKQIESVYLKATKLRLRHSEVCTKAYEKAARFQADTYEPWTNRLPARPHNGMHRMHIEVSRFRWEREVTRRSSMNTRPFVIQRSDALSFFFI